MIDTHAHLFLCDSPLETLIANAQAAGVTHIMNVATCVKNGFEALDSTKHPMISASIGIHPCEPESYKDIHLVEEALQNHPFKAIGETGIDYYHNLAPREAQMANFEAHLKLGQKYKLPVIVHNRQADQDVKTLLLAYPDVKKVVHCFSSDWAYAKEILCPTTYFSFTGMITYSQNPKMLEVIRELPLNQIMIETDCPYLTPDPHRGKPNEPAFVGEVAKQIAKIKNCPVEDIIRITTDNAKHFFGI